MTSFKGHFGYAKGEDGIAPSSPRRPPWAQTPYIAAVAASSGLAALASSRRWLATCFV